MPSVSAPRKPRPNTFVAHASRSGRASLWSTLSQVWTRLRLRSQRRRRGWTEADLAHLDRHLCATLADQLDELADTLPAGPLNAELHLSAAKLRVYVAVPTQAGLVVAQEALAWVAANLDSLHY